MRYRPKVLFCDVDRTLLTHRHVLLPEVVRAMRTAVDAGLQIILASARSPTGVQHILEDLQLAGPTVCFNGAWIGEANSLIAWQSSGIPRATAIGVVKCAMEAELVPMWYGEAAVYSLVQYADVARRQAAVTRDRLFLVHSADELIDDPLKVMFVTPPDQGETARLRLAAGCGGAVSIVRSGPGLIEVVRNGVSKAQAAAKLCDLLGRNPEECAAAGDSENDLEMLRWAGTALTVENGVDEARRIAQFIGGHCDVAGITTVIEWLLLQPEAP